MYRIIGISPPRIAPARIGVADGIAVAVLVGVERVGLLGASGERVVGEKRAAGGIDPSGRAGTRVRGRGRCIWFVIMRW